MIERRMPPVHAHAAQALRDVLLGLAIGMTRQFRTCLRRHTHAAEPRFGSGFAPQPTPSAAVPVVRVSLAPDAESRPARHADGGLWIAGLIGLALGLHLGSD